MISTAALDSAALSAILRGQGSYVRRGLKLVLQDRDERFVVGRIG